MGEHEAGNMKVAMGEGEPASQHETVAKVAQGKVAQGERKERVERTETETRRVEAFSDAVFAIAITLLVLDLRLPVGLENATNWELFGALTGLWPRYLALVISFSYIGAIWINHHRIFTLIHHIDAPLLLFNLMVLFGL